MNIEQLTKSQLVLLALLLSFVTSIATGIVTVSLMEQAPPVIAQTVNRVVERTIETVVPASQAAASATVRERTVIVRESELISQAVTKISPSVVRLYADSSEGAAFLGLGIVLNTEGAIVSDASTFSTSSEAAVALPNGTRLRIYLTNRDTAAGLVFLQATTTEEVKHTWIPAIVAVSNPILGQTVIALSGRTVVRIEDGIVTALIPVGEGESPSSHFIDTNISPDFIIAGSPLMNTEGEVVGVSTDVSRTSSPNGFIASTVLVKQPATSTQSMPSTSQ